MKINWVLITLSFFLITFFIYSNFKLCSNRETNKKELSNEFFETTSMIALNLKNSRGEEILDPGFTAILSSNVTEAIDCLSEVKNPNFIDLANILIGELYYFQQDFDQAALTFQKIIAQCKQENIRDLAEWYLALTYMAKKSTEFRGQRSIEQIYADSNHSHYPDAKKWLIKTSFR